MSTQKKKLFKSKLELFSWMVTLQETVDTKSPLPGEDCIKELLETLKCSKYCFQLERGKVSGSLHYQITFVLEKKLTGEALLRKIRKFLSSSKANEFYAKGCCSYLPTASQSDVEIYCTKTETRIKGPWVFPINKYSGADLPSELSYYPWQRELVTDVIALPPHPRAIDCFIDEKGNTGKSSMMKLLTHQGKARLIPIGLSAAQMKSAIVDAGEAETYILDLPRNTISKSIIDIYDTIEDLKRGHIVSSFHGKYRELFMNRPRVVVFSNTMPDVKMLSTDMWRIRRITDRNAPTEMVDTHSLKFDQEGKTTISKNTKQERERLELVNSIKEIITELKRDV